MQHAAYFFFFFSWEGKERINLKEQTLPQGNQDKSIMRRGRVEDGVLQRVRVGQGAALRNFLAQVLIHLALHYCRSTFKDICIAVLQIFKSVTAFLLDCPLFRLNIPSSLQHSSCDWVSRLLVLLALEYFWLFLAF